MRHLRGFTLVEVMVAISVLSLLALMGWRGLDTQLRTRERVAQQMNGVAQLQTALAQWNTDLQAMTDMGSVPALDYDGLVLRITRIDASLADQPLRVVAWSRRVISDQHGGKGSWVRWQSPALYRRADLDLAWAQAQRWARNPSQADIANEVAIAGITGWKLLYFRKDSWSHPLSATDSASDAGAKPTEQVAPEAVRLVLDLSADQGVAGQLVSDWIRLVGSGETSP